ncbi:MAG: 16S rRNA (adenine(1518)-N(6)/adenine(1519)-N(6))-dimethyltransferase RsmA [Bacilli bacterium]|jgi:16S rRNA (adenine1518-N6/adenine1519-N6)-dimethyltransferase
MKFTDQSSFFDYIKSLRYIASKELGQNFLINPLIAQAIVNALDVQSEDNVLEIGAGFGSLSYFLASHQGLVNLLDVDPKPLLFLKEQFGDKANVSFTQESILKHDLARYQRIIGNLPYYITNSTIEHVLLNARSAKKLVFMVQKEVLSRLIASVGDEGYGPLSILISYLGTPKRLINVKRQDFCPPPHVDSVVLSIDLNENINYEMASQLFAFAKALFHHRRKTVKNNLRILLKNSENANSVLNLLAIDGDKRPQDLDLKSYLALTKQLKF